MTISFALVLEYYYRETLPLLSWFDLGVELLALKVPLSKSWIMWNFLLPVCILIWIIWSIFLAAFYCNFIEFQIGACSTKFRWVVGVSHYILKPWCPQITLSLSFACELQLHIFSCCYTWIAMFIFSFVALLYYFACGYQCHTYISIVGINYPCLLWW